MPRTIVALFAGALFGVGLVVSGMADPRKVIGFLNFAGDWDPILLPSSWAGRCLSPSPRFV